MRKSHSSSQKPCVRRHKHSRDLPKGDSEQSIHRGCHGAVVENHSSRFLIKDDFKTHRKVCFDYCFMHCEIFMFSITENRVYLQGQSKRYDTTVLMLVQHLVAEHQLDRNTLLQSLLYAHNTQVHRSTSLTSKNLVSSHIFPSITTQSRTCC